MVFEALYILVPWTEEILSPSRFHLNYPLFWFVGPLPDPLHHVEPYVLAVLAVGIMLGYRFRLCAALFTLLFAHVFFVDQLVFNNHLYLYMLVAGLLTVTPAASVWSLDSRRKRMAGVASGYTQTVPAWSLYLIRFQLFVLYFFGGIAKLNADWLQGEPVRYWMGLVSDRLWLGSLVGSEIGVMSIAYIGIIFDLLIGFFLLQRKTFLWAALATIVFHASNSQLFIIGSFPVFGILSLVVFVPTGTGRRWFESVRGWLAKGAAPAESSVPEPGGVPAIGTKTLSTGGLVLLGAYALFQLAMPLRPWILPGNPSWTDSADTFSWRMMLRQKDAEARFVVSPEAQKLLARYPQLQLTHDQGKVVAQDPNLLHQYAKWLSGMFAKAGIEDTSVRIKSVCSLNGRPYQPMIDPTVDLSIAENPILGTASWIVPLDESAPIGAYPKTTDERNRLVQLAFHAADLMVAADGKGGAVRGGPAQPDEERERDVAGK